MSRQFHLLGLSNIFKLMGVSAYVLLTFAALAPLAAVQAQVLRCTDPRTGEVTYTDAKCPERTQLKEVQPPISKQEAAQQRARTEAALQEKQQRLAAQALEAQKQADAAKAAQAASPYRTDTPTAAQYAASAECARTKSQLQALDRDASTRATQAFLEASSAAQRQVELACLGPDRYAKLEIARATQPRIVTPPATTVQPWPYVQPGYGYRHPYGYGYAQPMAPVFPSVAPSAPPPRLTQCTDYHCTDNQGQKYPKYGKGRFPGQGGVCKSVGGQAPC